MFKQEFFDYCDKKYTKKDILVFKKAIEFIEQIFGQRKRLSGELFVEHNLNVGGILVENNFCSEVVVAGLLYGIENEILPSKLQEVFGKNISDLVYGQLQLKEIKFKHKFAEFDVLRKILLVTLNDPQIIFVKLADKLENLKSISVFSGEEQKNIAKEVLNIYAPLANRLGIESLKRQLEDEAFKILNPKKYIEIVNFLKESREERKKFVDFFIKEISGLFEGIEIVKIKGREKHIYSIYKKIVERKIPLDLHRDHFAIRIIVNFTEDCYRVLGILHEKYKIFPGTLNDYIVNPKSNGYQSLHTCLNFKGKSIEVQIRTREMDEIAEEGNAAHWKYKGINSEERFEKKLSWLRSVLDLQTEGNNDLLKSIKVSLFGEKFYCYTPKGKAIELPRGSTVLDFAYHVHQHIGDRAVGGRINGSFVSLREKLDSGDVVEILTNKLQVPHRDWIKFVVSTRAKSFIKKSIKKRENVSISSQYSLKKEEKVNFDSLVCSDYFSNHIFSLARCCVPLPPNKILGVLKTNKKVLVHDSDCEKIINSKNKIVPVFWKEVFNRPIKFFVIAKERSGILADFLNTIIQGGFVVKNASVKILEKDNVECIFVVVPQELENVISLIKRIEKVQGFKEVRFE